VHSKENPGLPALGLRANCAGGLGAYCINEVRLQFRQRIVVGPFSKHDACLTGHCRHVIIP
jgi:hypothetical protein